MKYGEHTEKIESIIDQVQNLTPEQVESLGAAWGEVVQDSAAWETAYETAYETVLGAPRSAVRKVVWDDAYKAVRNASYAPSWGVNQVAGWDAVWCIIRDVTLAHMTKDLISEEDFRRLCHSWDSVMN